MSRKPRRPRRDHYGPILIPILDAFDMLRVGVTNGYHLVNTGRIETVLNARAWSVWRRLVGPARSAPKKATSIGRALAHEASKFVAPKAWQRWPGGLMVSALGSGNTPRQRLVRHLHRRGPRPVLAALIAVEGGQELDAVL